MLVSEIDAARMSNLSSSIRTFVLNYYQKGEERQSIVDRSEEAASAVV